MFDVLTNTESPQTGNEDKPLKGTLPAVLTAISHKSKLIAILSDDKESPAQAGLFSTWIACYE